MAKKKVIITVDDDSHVIVKMEGCSGDHGAVDFQRMLNILESEYGIKPVNKQEQRTSSTSNSSTNRSAVSA